jgi:VWFA-related protein
MVQAWFKAHPGPVPLGYTGIVPIRRWIPGVLSFALLPAQVISQAEIRVSSKPYVAQPSFQVETKLVEVGVVVRDGHGRAISGLTRDNFRIQDNGKDREISNFAVDSVTATDGRTNASADGRASEAAKTAAPRERFLALFIDDVNAKDGPDANDLKQTNEAAAKFLQDAMKPGVHVGVFTASGAQRLDFTTDLKRVLDTVASVGPHVKLSENACVTPFIAYMMVVRHDESALTLPQNAIMDVNTAECRATARALADEVWKRTIDLSVQTMDSIGEVVDHLGAMQGSRVLLMASSGFITETLEAERDRLISRALHQNVVINALDSKGVFEWAPPHTREYRLQGPDAAVAAGLARSRFEAIAGPLRVEALNEGAAAIAEGTGGEFFHGDNNLHTGFERLANLPETRYRLSFKIQDVAADGAFHKLKVNLANVKTATAQVRPGYFAPDRKVAVESAASRFDTQVIGSETIQEFPVEIGAERGKAAGNEVAVAFVAKIDISKLDLLKDHGRMTGKLRLVSALKDSHGAIVAAKEATLDLSLKQATYDRLAKGGLSTKLTLEVPAGSYELREVVEDGTGKMACSTNPIEVK